MMTATGFKKKPEDRLLTNSPNNISSIGYCPALLLVFDRSLSKPLVVDKGRGGSVTTTRQEEEGEEEQRYPVIVTHVFSEVAAIPTVNRPGRRIILGLATQPTPAKNAVDAAIFWVERNLDALTQLMGKPPYIDFNRNVRLRQDPHHPDKAVADKADVDIILHVPPYITAFFLAPSMVIAIVMMLWRQPCDKLRSWSAFGSLDLMGQLYGYPELTPYYMKSAIQEGFKTLLVPLNQKVVDSSSGKGEQVKKNLKIVPCGTMMDMIKVVVNFVVNGLEPPNPKESAIAGGTSAPRSD